MFASSFKQSCGAIVVALAIFFLGTTFVSMQLVQGKQTSTVAGLVTLQTMVAQSMSYSEAIANSKPTLIKFSPNCCATCQTMPPTLEKTHEQFASDVSFMMLNINDPQWQSAVTTYKVTGVSHFALLEADQTTIDSFIRKIPFQIRLSEGLNSLVS